MIQPFFVFSDWTFLVLRVVLGAVMIYHGLPKLKNLKATIDDFASMGLKPGIFWALLSGIAEFLGGVFLVLGFLTQVASLVLAIQFVLVVLWVKGLKNFKSLEFDLLILASLLVLMTVGGGALSVDGFFGLFLY